MQNSSHFPQSLHDFVQERVRVRVVIGLGFPENSFHAYCAPQAVIKQIACIVKEAAVKQGITLSVSPTIYSV